MRKVQITVMQTRVLQRECEVSDEEYDFLNGVSGTESASLNEMFNDVVDSKYASEEYDYAVKDCKTGEMLVNFLEVER